MKIQCSQYLFLFHKYTFEKFIADTIHLKLAMTHKHISCSHSGIWHISVQAVINYFETMDSGRVTALLMTRKIHYLLEQINLILRFL